MPDLFEALLAFDVRFAFGGSDALVDSVLRKVTGGLVAPGVLEAAGEVVDEGDVPVIVMPCLASFSDVLEKRRPGVLMSCFEIRFGSEAPLETMRAFTVGTASVPVFADFSLGRENLLRRMPVWDGRSPSVSESNAETSADRSCKGERSGWSEEGEVGVPEEVVQAETSIGVEMIASVVSGVGLRRRVSKS